MQSQDYTMSAAPSPTFLEPHTPAATPGANGAALSSLYELFASGAAPTGGHSPSADFAEMLAEFTTPSNALSPEALGKSPEPSGPGEMEGVAFGAGISGKASRQRERSAHEVLLEQLGFPVSKLAPQGGPVGSPAPTSKEQVNQAIANMDAGTRAQLLSALLNLKQQATSPAASNPSPHASGVSPRPAQSPRYHELPSQGSPLAYSSQPPSQHNSPQPFTSYNSPVPHPLQQQLAPHPHPTYQPLPTALNTSLPPSAVSSPLHSPYIQSAAQQQNYFAAAAQLQAQGQSYGAVNPANFQKAFSPRPFDPSQQQQQQQSDSQAQQLAMEMIARVNGGGGQGLPDMAMRGGSATGGSYATTADDGDWAENDFVFSPLMSPALTPQSVFTQASSLPTSSYLPTSSIVSPADFFSPLGSPAIMPQQFQDDPVMWRQQQQQRASSLQGLVDQTRALGFDSSNLAALQAQGFGSPNAFMVQGQQGMSPRLGPHDAGQSTGAGSGRRGASSKKTRPSPLLKPTPDGPLRRKKAAGPADRRSASISSANGARSATTSPFLGPTGSKAHSISSAASAQGQSHSSGSNSGSSQKATPPEDGSNGINTPSPVDLAMGEHPPASQTFPELMGPPPPPSSSSSRRQSLNGHDPSQWLGPVTPASFMNLPTDFNVNDLSALTPGLTSVPTQQILGSASGSLPSRSVLPALPALPALPNLPNLAGAGTDLGEPRYRQPKLVESAPSHSDLSGDLQVSPALSATKGKGRATAAGGKKATGKVKPSPKVGPATKIKPLIASGAAPDSLSRLSNKSNYQNIVEGHGDVLGLNASAVSALNTSHSSAAGADNRRTSHKAAEQKRRDSLKARFEELRVLLPPIATTNNEERRPGEGNVGGQRNGSIDPDNPNRGVSKVALLRRSNEYMGMLLERVERRDHAIDALRFKMQELKERLGIEEDDEDDIPGLDLDNIDRDEREAGTMAFYENLSDDDEPTPKTSRKTSTSRRKSTAAQNVDARPKPAARRSARKSNAGVEAEEVAMEMEA